MKEFEDFLLGLNHTPYLATLVAISAVLFAAWLGNFVVKRLLLRGLGKMLGLLIKERNGQTDVHRAVARVANVVPALIIMGGVGVVPGLPQRTSSIIMQAGGAFIALTFALAFSAVLDGLGTIYNSRPKAKTKPIKGYIQVAKIVLFGITAIVMISALTGSSPLVFLSGLGAMTAVLMLIFQDTILSFVASVQISSGDTVRVGDWIEMPNLNADGDVIDIALHTIKVQNWDKTVTTFPTRRLITDPFKNWRGMHESGGRRIKRPIYIDQSSIGFLKEEEIARLQRFVLIKEYLRTKGDELGEWNAKLGEAAIDEVNWRRISNLGTFRAYVLQYLKANPGVNQGMTTMVRQLAPTAEGLPLEIYCFTSSTAWAVHEGTQSDLFDHLLSILPEFGLRVFQSPSGVDFRALGARETEGG